MFALVQSFDNSVLYALLQLRGEPLTSFMRDVSFFGEWYILLPLAAVLVFLFSRAGLTKEATELAYSVVGTSVVIVFLKTIADRPRPPEALQLVSEVGYSFPSWHAAIAVAFWGYLVYVALRRIKNRSIRLLLVSLTVLLILTICFSRLYLGVHYFSDVLAGFAIGLIALWLSIRFTKPSRATV